MNFDPHLRVEYKTESNSDDYAKIISTIKQTPDLKSFAPFVSGKVLTLSDGITQVVSLKGIQLSNEDEIYNIKESILFGNSELELIDDQARSFNRFTSCR